MSSSKSFIMPDEFLPIQLTLQSSICETTILTPTAIQPNTLQSKLAGYPYLPKNEQPVLDDNGQPMLLLAQLNFADIIAPKEFPTEGILQFFIAQNCYEDYTLEQANSLFSVRYYSTITSDLDISTPNYLHDANFTNFPIHYEQLLVSHTHFEPVSATDFRLAHYIDSNFLAQPFTTGGQTLHDIYFEYFLSADHKIGGYPYFIDEDIRVKNPSFYKYDTLLFQLISNDAQSIMWGDSGVISFFINAEKLKKRDFNDILFYAEDY
ncbi:MAG: YwqG family protein [Solibacillus sp.]